MVADINHLDPMNYKSAYGMQVYLKMPFTCKFCFLFTFSIPLEHYIVVVCSHFNTKTVHNLKQMCKIVNYHHHMVGGLAKPDE